MTGGCEQPRSAAFLPASASGSTGVLVLTVFVILGLINLQLWNHEFPALIDWPNHLARHAIQCADPLLGGLSAFYSFELRPIPYLASDLVHTLSLACRSIEITQKVLIQFATFGLAVSASILHFVIWRRWSVWPAVAALLVHHLNFAWGFENFAISIPPAFLLIALWVALGGKSLWLRVAVMAPLAGAQYFLHLYSFAFLVLVIGCFEVQRAVVAEGPIRQRLPALASSLVGVGLVVLVPALHFLSVLGDGQTPGPGASSFGGIESRILALLSSGTPFGIPVQDAGIIVMSLVPLVTILLLALIAGVFGHGLQFDRRFVFPALAALVVCAATPHILATVAWTHIRFPVMTALLLIVASDIRGTSRRLEMGVAVVVIALFLLRVEWIEHKWRIHGGEVSELLAATAGLGPDDRLLVAREEIDMKTMVHLHSAIHVAMRTGAFVPSVFNGSTALIPVSAVRERTRWHMFPVHRANLVDEAAGGAIADRLAREGEDVYWRDWRSFYTHVLVLAREPDPGGQLSRLSRQVTPGSFFGLYEIAR